MKQLIKPLVVVAALSLTVGCSTGEKRVLTGTAIGAGTGALVSGNSGKGALVGAGVGAAAGYLYHKSRDD